RALRGGSMKLRLLLALAGALSLALATDGNARPPNAPLRSIAPAPAADRLRSPILVSMQEELDRAMHRLRMPGYEAPYFIAYSVRDYDTHEVTARYGGVISHNQLRN